MNLKYCDENNQPGTIQADGSYDGGDTAAIIGTIKALSPVNEALLVPLPPWNIWSAVPLRHPDITKWYGQPDRFSRDQLIPNLCAQIRLGEASLYRLYGAHKRKYFLTAWNTKGNGQIDMPNKFPDICGPEVWALWIRILKPWWAVLALWLLDVQTLIGAFQWRWFTPATNRVTRNHMLVCIATRDNSPTVTSKLANAVNDWPDLVSRWEAHCAATGEYPTAYLFKQKLGLK